MKPEIQAKLDEYLRQKEAGGLPTSVMAHGPGGLMSHPGMGERKRRRAEFLHTLVNKMKINQKKAIDLVNAVDKMRDAAVEKHLGSQHNQSTHGGGGGSPIGNAWDAIVSKNGNSWTEGKRYATVMEYGGKPRPAFLSEKRGYVTATVMTGKKTSGGMHEFTVFKFNRRTGDTKSSHESYLTPEEFGQWASEHRAGMS